MRPASFALTKFCPTLPNFKEAATKNRRGLSDFLSGDFISLSCLFIVTKSISTFQRAYRYGIMLIQKRAKLGRTSMQLNATSMDRENFARFPQQNFDFQRFQGAAGIGPYLSLLTDEQEQRGSSFNYYGSQIFSSQIINEEQSSKSIPPNLLLLLQLLHRIRNSMKH